MLVATASGRAVVMSLAADTSCGVNVPTQVRLKLRQVLFSRDGASADKLTS